MTDPLGNVYVTGYFQETADFDPGPEVYNMTSVGNDDIFVSKFDANGQFVWAVSFGDFDFDWGAGITTDTFGNVILTGYFKGTVDFDPGPGTYNLSAGSIDIYVLKLDADGSFVWARNMGGQGDDTGRAIVLDDSGNVYTTGRFQETADFDPGPNVYNLTANGETDIFVSKLNNEGNFVWAKSIGGSSEDQGNSIALDSANNVYTTGYFRNDAVDFNPGPGQHYLTAIGGSDMFVLKLNSDGAFTWAINIGGPDSQRGLGIAIDKNFNVYTTGYFRGTVDFDTGPGTYNLTSSGERDIYILKLDTNGAYVWVKSFGAAENDKGYAIALDKNGNVYTTGEFVGTVDFDPGPGTYNLSSSAEWDSYVQKLDTDGSFIWAGSFAGNDEIDSGYAITIDDLDNIYTTGFFQNTMDFDPDLGVYELTSHGEHDAFIHKLNQQACAASPTYLEFITCDPFSAGFTTFVSPGQNGCDSIVIEATTLLIAPEMPIAPADLLIQVDEPPFQITVPEVPNTTLYAWVLQPGVLIISGANTNSITVDWGNAAGGSVCVTAINQCGTSPAACMEVTLDITDGLNDINRKGYSIFPNPAVSYLNVVFDDDGQTYEITLLDVLGRVILPQAKYLEQSKIEVSQLPVGTYWLKISRSDEVFWERVEVLR